jgi:hypothetical protein
VTKAVAMSSSPQRPNCAANMHFCTHPAWGRILSQRF